jgi:phosphoglycerol transferase MdoB-like AlkP superfamily enzyme
MRQLFLGIAISFSVLSVVFVFLPLGTLALIPVVIAFVFGFLALKKSDASQAKLVKVLLIISGLCLVFILGKEIFIKDEVEADQQFDTQKVESKKEAQKELEDLEGLE